MYVFRNYKLFALSCKILYHKTESFLNFQPEESYAIPSKIKPPRRCNYVNIDPHSDYIPMYGCVRKGSKKVRAKVRRCQECSDLSVPVFETQ